MSYGVAKKLTRSSLWTPLDSKQIHVFVAHLFFLFDLYFLALHWKPWKSATVQSYEMNRKGTIILSAFFGLSKCSCSGTGTSYIHPFKDFLTSKAPISTNMGPNLVWWTMNCLAPPKSVPFINMYPIDLYWTIKLRSPKKNQHLGIFGTWKATTPRRQGTTSATCGATRLVPSFTLLAPSWPSSIFMGESCLELDHSGWRWKNPGRIPTKKGIPS